jgi:hypothetical protein
MDKIQQLEHRLAMVLDDLQVIRRHIDEHDLAEKFELPTVESDECWTHFNNIEIACDLNSKECLIWTPFTKKNK